jgi:hypothetical protein
MVDDTVEDMVVDSGDSDESKGKEGKKLRLMVGMKGYCIYSGASSFVVYKPTNSFSGYFTNLGSCVREVYRCMIIDKALNKDPQLKRDVEFLMDVIKEATAEMEEFTKKLNDVTFSMLEEKKQKEQKAKKSENGKDVV